MSSRPNRMARRRHELLADVESAIKSLAMDIGIPSEQALHLGMATADMLSEHWGGQQITFPLNGYYGVSPRELEIATRHNQGARVYELAREFGMTERGVRKLLKRVANRQANTNGQLDLFDPSAQR